MYDGPDVTFSCVKLHSWKMPRKLHYFTLHSWKKNWAKWIFVRFSWMKFHTWKCHVWSIIRKSFWIECLEKHGISQSGISALVKASLFKNLDDLIIEHTRLFLLISALIFSSAHFKKILTRVAMARYLLVNSVTRGPEPAWATSAL